MNLVDFGILVTRDVLANVLGVLSLVVTDELGRAVIREVVSVIDAAALLVFGQFLDGVILDRVYQVFGVTFSGAVRFVDRLERVGLVSWRFGADGRSRSVCLMLSGCAVAVTVGDVRAVYLGGFFDGLIPDEVDQLRFFFAKVMVAVV